MDPFYQNITSFPTVIFTFVLAICVLYWLLAVLGVVDIDVLDIDVDVDLGNEAVTPQGKFVLKSDTMPHKALFCCL